MTGTADRSSSIVSPQQNIDARTTSSPVADFLVTSVPPVSGADSTDQRSSLTSSIKNPHNSVDIAPTSESLARAGGTGNLLTDEQVDFVNNLHSLNIPAPAIAHVMQRMMAGQEVGDMAEISTAAGSHGVRRANTAASAAPPSYSS